jgi:hypothetical protein
MFPYRPGRRVIYFLLLLIFLCNYDDDDVYLIKITTCGLQDLSP